MKDSLLDQGGFMTFYKRILHALLMCTLASCVTAPGLSADSDISFEEEESLFFEEDNLNTQAESVSQNQDIEVAQEKQVEGELEKIEDEFADFIEDDSSVAVRDEIESEPESEEEIIISENTTDESLDVENEEDDSLLEEIVKLEESEELEDTPESDVIELQEQAPQEVAIAEEAFVEDVAADSKNEIDNNKIGAKTQITDIRYENENIYIDTRGGRLTYRSRFNDTTRQFIIEIPRATIISQLKWPYIMKEFKSDFALLQADQKSKDTVRIIVQMKPNSKVPVIMQKDGENQGLIIASSTVDLTSDSLYADDDSSLSEDDSNLSEIDNKTLDITEEEEESFFTADNVEVSKPSSSGFRSDNVLQAKTVEEFILSEHKFYGNKITLDIRDAKIKDILYFLLEETGLNMVISDRIPSSSISIRLKEVPWDQALVFIMKKQKLAYTRKGNVLYISTLQDFQQERRDLQDLIRQRDALAPLKLEIIPVAYVQASSLQSHIELFKSNKGQIKVDTENNALIIYDIDSSIKEMKKLISDLDRTPKQVMIAAKIVEVTENFSKNFGISFTLGGAPFSLSPGGGVQFSPSTLLEILPGAPDSGTIGSRFRVGSFPLIGDLEARLGLAETEGSVKVLSSPRIMALNNESATVTQSSESISFTSVLSAIGTSQTSITKSPVSLSLSVTPVITNVDSIYMQVQMQRDFEGERVGQGDTSARPIHSRNASTRILVKSGQTAVIGGVYEDQKTNSLIGLPFVKHIPILRWLFSKVSAETIKTELLLFLTPRIIDVQSQDSGIRAASYNGIKKK